jgi:hypothetical protein
MVNWLAVLYGVATGIVIGLVSGLGLPFTDATLPVVGYGLGGFIAGGVAGYFAREGIASGAIHGLLGTSIGALFVVGVLILFSTVLAGLIGLSAGLAALVVVLAYGVPGVIGGAVGGLLEDWQARRTGRPTA